MRLGSDSFLSSAPTDTRSSTTRSAGKVSDVRALGAEPVVLDVLDAEAVGRAVSEAEPDVVVHQATALSDLGSLRNLDEAFEETNRLRTVGTDNLLAAAQAAGAGSSSPRARRLAVREGGLRREGRGGAARSVPAGERRADHGGDSAPRGHRRRRRGDRRDRFLGTAGSTGPAPRCSRAASTSRRFASARSRSWVAVPECGRSSTSTTSRARLRGDRARPARSLQHRRRRAGGDVGVASVSGRGARCEAAPVACRSGSGGLAGDQLVSMMTEGRGASNAKAKRELGWKLIYPTWREGFVNGLMYEQERSAA